MLCAVTVQTQPPWKGYEAPVPRYGQRSCCTLCLMPVCAARQWRHSQQLDCAYSLCPCDTVALMRNGAAGSTVSEQVVCCANKVSPLRFVCIQVCCWCWQVPRCRPLAAPQCSACWAAAAASAAPAAAGACSSTCAATHVSAAVSRPHVCCCSQQCSAECRVPADPAGAVHTIGQVRWGLCCLPVWHAHKKHEAAGCSASWCSI